MSCLLRNKGRDEGRKREEKKGWSRRLVGSEERAEGQEEGEGISRGGKRKDTRGRRGKEESNREETARPGEASRTAAAGRSDWSCKERKKGAVLSQASRISRDKRGSWAVGTSAECNL